MGATSQLTIGVNGVVNSTAFVSSSVTYQQTSSFNVDSVTSSGNQITFTGTGFPTADHIGRVTLEGVAADAVTITSATEVTASFSSTGIPATTSVPELVFETTTNNYQHTAVVSSVATFTKVQDVTSSTGISSSFNGGLKYTVQSDGLYATLKKADNELRVCGSVCELVEADSNASQAVCTVPALATTHSVSTYQIESSKDLNATLIGDRTVHDGLTVDPWVTTDNPCEFGMTFKEGHAAVLDEAKIFIGFLTDKTPYVNNLAFYGSNDNWVTETELHRFGEELHEGWNYIDYRDDGVVKPSWNSYKFKGNETGSCRVTEFKLHGVQAVADTASSYACTPKIFLNGT